MNKSTMIAAGVALCVGFLLGYNTRDREKFLEQAAPPAVASAVAENSSASMPEGHPPMGGTPDASGGISATGMPPVGEEIVLPGAIEGLAAMRAGDYTAAARTLKAASEKDPEPRLRILHAIAAQGAGDAATALKLVKGDADISLLRSAARDAFMRNQDMAVAGPGYELYLRLKPDEPNKAMMENAVKMWKDGTPAR